MMIDVLLERNRWAGLDVVNRVAASIYFNEDFDR